MMLKRLFFVLLLALGLVSPAAAVLRTFTVSGSFTDDESATSPYLTVGNRYTLSLNYDTAATPTYSLGGTNATYLLSSATLEIKWGSNLLTVSSASADNKVIIRRESFYSGYDFYIYLPAFLDFSQGMVVTKLNGNFGSNYFTALSLPLNPLQSYTSAKTTISGNLSSSIIVSEGSAGTIFDTAAPTAVPESSTIAVAVGLCALSAVLFGRKALHKRSRCVGEKREAGGLYATTLSR